MEWLKNQLDNHQLYRRILVFYACCLTWYATTKSVEYAHISALPGFEVAAVITAIQAPLAAMMMFLSKLYWGGRNE